MYENFRSLIYRFHLSKLVLYFTWFLISYVPLMLVICKKKMIGEERRMQFYKIFEDYPIECTAAPTCFQKGKVHFTSLTNPLCPLKPLNKNLG